MLDLVVAGTISLDDIKTPLGTRKSQVGGCGFYAALAAAKFCRVGLVGQVGTEFNADTLYQIAQTVDTEGVAIQGTTARWSLKYDESLKDAQHLAHHPSSDNFQLLLPEHFRQTLFHFIGGNLDPDQQSKIISQVSGPQRFVALSTKDRWIHAQKQTILKILKGIDLVILNKREIQELCGTHNLIQAGYALLRAGPQFVVVTKGADGVLLYSSRGIFAISSYPVENPTDPTGAGDSFAGALLGYLANQYQDATNLSVNEPMVRKAIAAACASASFTVEGFGAEILTKATREEIKQRYEFLKQMQQF